MSYVPDPTLMKPYLGYGSSNQAYSNNLQYQDSTLYVPDFSSEIAHLQAEIDAIVLHPIDIMPFDPVPTAAGLSATGNDLALHAAGLTAPGGVSTTAQEFGGIKTLTTPVIKGIYGLTQDDRVVTVTAGGVLGTSTGGSAITVGTPTAFPANANGATITAGVLSLSLATSTSPGMLSLSNQVFTGVKSLTSPLLLGVYSTPLVDKVVSIDSFGNLGTQALPGAYTVGPVINPDPPLSNLGMKISGNTIQLFAAYGTSPGLMTTDAQTYYGLKGFLDGINIFSQVLIGRPGGSFLSTDVDESCVFLGPGSGTLVAGADQVAVGQYAGSALIGTSNKNTLVGSISGWRITSGDANIGVGAGSASNCTTGNRNICIGNYAGSAVSTTGDNIFIGNLGQGGDANTIRLGDDVAHTSCRISGIRDKLTGLIDGQIPLIASDSLLASSVGTRFYNQMHSGQIARGNGTITSGIVNGGTGTIVGSNLSLGANILVQIVGNMCTISFPVWYVTGNTGTNVTIFSLANVSPAIPAGSTNSIGTIMLSNNSGTDAGGYWTMSGTSIVFTTSVNLNLNWGMAGGAVSLRYAIA